MFSAGVFANRAVIVGKKCPEKNRVGERETPIFVLSRWLKNIENWGALNVDFVGKPGHLSNMGISYLVLCSLSLSLLHA